MHTPLSYRPLQHFLREVRSSYAFIDRSINLIRRYWAWELVWLVYATVNALAITFIAKASGEITGQPMSDEVIQIFILYLMVGTLVWHYLSVIFDIVSEAIQWERWEGTIEYTFMAPVSRITHLFGQSVFAVAYGIIHTIFILTVITIFFDISMEHANIMTVSILMTLGSLGFIGLGLIAAILPLLWPEKGIHMTNIIKATILLVSGVYYPITVLPSWLQPLSFISPATYMLEGMRAALLDGASIGDVWYSAFLPLVLVSIATIPIGFFAFNRAERYARRTGLLKRNG